MHSAIGDALCRDDLTDWLQRQDASGDEDMEDGESSDEDSEASDNEAGAANEVVDNTPLCSGGFDGIVIRNLMDISKLVGIDGGVALDTRIVNHWSPPPGAPPPPYEHEIVVAVGVRGTPITLEDITRALMSIPRDAWQPGRSYFWEGIFVSPDGRAASIRWGS